MANENTNRQVSTVTQETRNFLQALIESKKLPGHVKTVEDAFTIQQMGRELGFPTMQAFHYIVPIQGKLSLSAKAIGALLKRGGVRYWVKEDGVYVFKDGSTSEYGTRGEGDNVTKAIDRRTTITFEREGVKEDISFTWIDATKMGLVDKDNWKKMPKAMLYARCLSKGADRVAPDLLLGLYSTDELFDHLGNSSLKVKRDDDGTITEIQDAEVVHTH